MGRKGNRRLKSASTSKQSFIAEIFSSETGLRLNHSMIGIHHAETLLQQAPPPT
jgi:hypothetical protein